MFIKCKFFASLKIFCKFCNSENPASDKKERDVACDVSPLSKYSVVFSPPLASITIGIYYHIDILVVVVGMGGSKVGGMAVGAGVWMVGIFDHADIDSVAAVSVVPMLDTVVEAVVHYVF